MAKIDKHIEIVVTSLRGLNFMSPKSREAIQAVLLKKYAHVDIVIINNASDLAELTFRRPDMVFLGIKFIPSNPDLGLSDPSKIWISEYLDEQGIPYTGSSHSAIALELDKELAKQCVAAAGLKTPRSLVVRSGERITPSEVTLSYPLFIKPTNRGGGTGIDAGSLVHNFTQLQLKVRSLSTGLRADALIEEYLPGREFSVAILRDVHTDHYSVMPIELIAPMNESGARFLSVQIKTMDTESNMEVTDKKLKARINALAVDAFRALGGRDYGRIDIRLDAMGVPHFLEANLVPSLKNNYGNYFPRACLLNINLKYEPMILQIASLAFRHRLAVDATPSAISLLAVPEPMAESA